MKTLFQIVLPVIALLYFGLEYGLSSINRSIGSKYALAAEIRETKQRLFEPHVQTLKFELQPLVATFGPAAEWLDGTRHTPDGLLNTFSVNPLQALKDLKYADRKIALAKIHLRQLEEEFEQQQDLTIRTGPESLKSLKAYLHSINPEDKISGMAGRTLNHRSTQLDIAFQLLSEARNENDIDTAVNSYERVLPLLDLHPASMPEGTIASE